MTFKRTLLNTMAFTCLTIMHAFGQSASVTFEQWISIRQAGSPILSPDGNHVLYSVTSTDWQENAYDSEYWLVKKDKAPIQLTRTTKGSSSGAKWSPDGQWIGFLADRGQKTQIYIMSVDGGEAMSTTN